MEEKISQDKLDQIDLDQLRLEVIRYSFVDAIQEIHGSKECPLREMNKEGGPYCACGDEFKELGYNCGYFGEKNVEYSPLEEIKRVFYLNDYQRSINSRSKSLLTRITSFFSKPKRKTFSQTDFSNEFKEVNKLAYGCRYLSRDREGRDYVKWRAQKFRA